MLKNPRSSPRGAVPGLHAVGEKAGVVRLPLLQFLLYATWCRCGAAGATRLPVHWGALLASAYGLLGGSVTAPPRHAQGPLCSYPARAPARVPSQSRSTGQDQSGLSYQEPSSYLPVTFCFPKDPSPLVSSREGGLPSVISHRIPAQPREECLARTVWCFAPTLPFERRKQ